MNTASPSPGLHAIDWLAPITRKALQLAQQEAITQRIAQIYPEHLLLGIIAEGQSRAATLLIQNGMEAALRKYIAEIPRSRHTLPIDADLPFSEEAQECIDRAIALITYYLSRNNPTAMVSPEHLVLSILYHPRMQKQLSSSSTTTMSLHNDLKQGMEPGFIRYMEELFLFPERIKDGGRKIVTFVSFNQGRNKRILKSVEYPGISFQDIAGQDEAKKHLRSLITRLRDSERQQTTGQGILLIGQKDINQTLFVQAIAGEVRLPLTIVFCSVICEMLTDMEQQEQLSLAEIIKAGRNFIREVFHPIKMFSYCIVFFDDIDSIMHFRSTPQRKEIILQLFTEIEKLAARQGVTIITSTAKPESLHPDFIQAAHFERRILLSKPVQLVQIEAIKAAMPVLNILDLNSCQQCKRTVQPHWKHCVFCSAPLLKRCQQCGTPYPEVEGARFCYECGKPLA